MMNGFREVKVLDHGYIKLVDAWGSDEDIIRSARMSTDGAFRGWGTPEAPGDEKLLSYLYRNNHHSPFEMAGFSVEVQLPIFVAREWQRHRTQSFNELSARYTPLPNVNYVPSMERLAATEGTSNQAKRVKGASDLFPEGASQFRQELDRLYELTEKMYQAWLQRGVPKELARTTIPVGRYTRMRAQANLRNWLGFLKLRLDETAQWEIRVYAREVAKMVEGLFPRTWKVAGL